MIRLEKYIKQVRGISYNPKDISEIPQEDFLPILKANNIQENGLDTSNLIYIHKSKIKEEQLIKKGDLLLAASSGSKEIVGKNVYFENDFRGSFGAFCKVVRPNQNIYPKFLSVFFKTPIYKRHIRNLIQGANINNLRNEDIDSLKIPIFSYQEQLHIANILSKAEILITQRKEIIRLLDEFLKSTFLEMFGDIRINNKNWYFDYLGNLYLKNSIVDGPFGSAINVKEDYIYKGEIPIVRTVNIKRLAFNFDDLKFIKREKYEKIIRSNIKPGDILISKVGTIGNVCIFPNRYQEAVLSTTGSTRIRNNNPNIHSQYLLHYLDFYKPFMIKMASTGVQPFLNLTHVKSFKILLPPIELQTHFSRIVEKTEVLKIKYQQSLQELENLYGSLSQRAFRGELKFGEMNTETAMV